MKASMTSGTVTFDEALPWLGAAYQAGRLVPFVGAGMSMNYCKGWAPFIEALCGALDLPLPKSGQAGTGPEHLYRAADRAASQLRLMPLLQRRQILAQALRCTDAAIPAQMAALTRGDWPLIVTTNYDDLIVSSTARRRPSFEPLVLGRGREDCVDVVRSLDSFQRPVIWHVQGHIAGFAGAGDKVPSELEQLLDQLVLGHQEYQLAINAEPAFRRAFAEVFRRRSLLFLGSGLAESYMVNLISEALHGLGPSPHPHYALMTSGEIEKADATFLSQRLGITPVEYGEKYEVLSARIDNLTGPAPTRPTIATVGPRGSDEARQRSSAGWLRSMSFDLQHVDGGMVEVCLQRGGLPDGDLAPDQCIILSVGLDLGLGGQFSSIAFGEQAMAFSEGNPRYRHVRAADFSAIDNEAKAGRAPHRLFQLKIGGELQAVLGASATVAGTNDTDDTRDLQTITEVTRQGLQAAARQYGRVRMGLIGAGDLRPFPSGYCLLAQLSGIRAFLEQPGTLGRLKRVDLYIYDEAAWLPLAQGRMPAGDLLSSGMARVVVRVFDAGDRCEEFALSVRLGGPEGTPTIRRVLLDYGYNIDGLEVSAFPFTQRSKGTVADGLLETAIFPGMVINAKPKNRQKVQD